MGKHKSEGRKARNRVSKWYMVVPMLMICGIVLLSMGTLTNGSTAQAAAPAWGGQAQGNGAQGKLEGYGAEVKPAAPRYTTAPSPFEPLVDPIFGPNVRANTDATTYAQ